jgi:hypothetical protein
MKDVKGETSSPSLLGVAGVGAALVTDHIRASSLVISDLALALISPLGTYDRYARQSLTDSQNEPT